MHTNSPGISNGFTPGYRMNLVKGGEEYFNLLIYLINTAAESIHLQTYIYDDDDTGLLVAKALKAAVKRGVQVYLLADGYASQGIKKDFIRNLGEEGIHFRFFEPLFKSRSYYFGRRMHHKIFIADTSRALVGGINVSNKYNDMPGKPAWLDFALYVEGEIARELCVLCWKTWNGFPQKMGLTPCELKTPDYNFGNEPASLVRIRRNDWVRRKNQISATYIQMLRLAEKNITILCSYFLPGRVIRRLLKNAAKRGVTIKVITAGPSDVMIAKRAERWLYDWMLRYNIELYEYQPSVLHAKVAVSDGKWVTIGSYNVNNISAYASIELNTDIYDPSFAESTEREINNILQHQCVRITKEYHHKNKNLFRQFIRWLSYETIRLIFHLITFYYRKEDR